MTLPHLLAGPIVRRVEPGLASVWVATSDACRVRLALWPGEISTGGGSGVFDPGGEVARGEVDTVRVGANLHIAVVVARAVNQPLLPGTRYSYNVIFARDGGATEDLATLGLLRDTPTQLALGYQANILPSLVTCPLRIDDLVLLHGSCNRIEAAGGPNLMFAIDEIIKGTVAEDGRAEAPRRPHQLWLSGDQVYADEVPAVLSAQLTAVGRELIGGDELIPLPVETTDLGIPIRQANLPAGYRQKLLVKDGGLTSSEAASHLLGVTERAAMQLHLWSPEVWTRAEDGEIQLPAVGSVLKTEEPPLLEALEELPTGMSEAQRGAALVWLPEHLTTLSERDLAVAARKAGEEVRLVLAYAAQVGRIRRALANVPTYMVFDDHDVTDDWNLCALWRERVLGNGLGRSVWRDGLVTFALFQGWGNDPAAYAGGHGAELLDAVARLFPSSGRAPDPAAVADLDRLLGLDGQPPLVRWNYTIDGAVHRVIACDTRTRRGHTGRVSPPIQLPDGERQTQIPEGPLPAGFELLVVVLSQPALDPVLLGEVTQGLLAQGFTSIAAIRHRMDAQTARDPVKRREATETWAMAGLETFDYEGWGARPLEVARLLDRLATYPRVLIMSGDVHFGVSLGLAFWRGEQLVSTIGQFTSSAVQYITFPEWILPVLGQGWVNELLGRGYPADYLVWVDPLEAPVSAPSLPARRLRRRMLQRPVLVPTTGWPDDASEVTAPDFAWRLQLLEDQRPDEGRPEPVRPEPLLEDFDEVDPLRGEHGYAALARRHAFSVRKHTSTRRVAIFNKVARLTFRHDDDRLIARSELVAVDHHRESSDPPAPFTVHELVYDEPLDTPRPRIGP